MVVRRTLFLPPESPVFGGRRVTVWGSRRGRRRRRGEDTSRVGEGEGRTRRGRVAEQGRNRVVGGGREQWGREWCLVMGREVTGGQGGGSVVAGS